MFKLELDGSMNIKSDKRLGDERIWMAARPEKELQAVGRSRAQRTSRTSKVQHHRGFRLPLYRCLRNITPIECGPSGTGGVLVPIDYR